jgi:SAM-dependent methyltransferase
MMNLYFKLCDYLRRGCKLGSRLLRRLEVFCGQRMEACEAQIQTQHRANVLRVTSQHNMAAHPDEEYYRRQYWHWIEKALTDFAQDGKALARVLDLGCGQGRLTLPLARWLRPRGGKVIGVDISAEALDFARRSAKQEGLAEAVELIEDDVFVFMQKQPSSSCQAIICTEVLYMLPEPEKFLMEAVRVLVSGGLLMASFRTRYYYILHYIGQCRWSVVSDLLASHEGFLNGPPTKFSWYNVRELTEMLTALGCKVHFCKGIGVCSGIKGDPLSAIVQPSSLTPEEQEELMAVELSLAEEMANCGRYILISATKNDKG